MQTVADLMITNLITLKESDSMAKAKALMAEKNIPYVEYDIEKSPVYRAQWAELGGRGVPVLVVNDNVIHGYRPAQILEYASQ